MVDPWRFWLGGKLSETGNAPPPTPKLVPQHAAILTGFLLNLGFFTSKVAHSTKIM